MPRLLDLFCGAQGAGMGYYRAGFDVLGVDVDPHPDAPLPMVVADALVYLETADLSEFAVIHASPPCQGFTSMSNRYRGLGGKADSWPDLIGPVRREALREWGGIYVIENVPGARSSMRTPVMLRGGHFGLRVDRPRLFESNVLILTPSTPARRRDVAVGVYGARPDGRRLFTRSDGRVMRAAASLAEGQAAMGIDWMTDWRDLCEAIPPAYTEHVGHQLLAHVRAPA